MDYITKIKGENIRLCVFNNSEDIIQKGLQWINDESINIYTGHHNKIIDYNQEKEWAKTAGKDVLMIINKDNEYIGNCSIEKIGDTRNYILGICIGEERARNKGIGTEVISLLIKYGFEQLNAHRIKLNLSSENKRALRCYQKAGFVVCGTEHETTWFNGHWSDTIIMEILEQNYFRNKED